MGVKLVPRDDQVQRAEMSRRIIASSERQIAGNRCTDRWIVGCIERQMEV